MICVRKRRIECEKKKGDEKLEIVCLWRELKHKPFINNMKYNVYICKKDRLGQQLEIGYGLRIRLML